MRRRLMFAHHNDCSRCPVIGAEDVGGDESYNLLSLRFSICIAQQLTRHHQPILVEPESLRRWISNTRIDHEHVGHVPLKAGPGLQVTLPAGCGKPIIDGNHRAARALLEDRDFYVYVLNEQETLELLRRSMDATTADRLWNRLAQSKPHPDDL
jgi:hypothetical protein